MENKNPEGEKFSSNKIIIPIIIIFLLIAFAISFYRYWWLPRERVKKEIPVDSQEMGCINSGGTVSTSLCCEGVDDFPTTCAIGACGCPPEDSHEVKTCNCGPDKCFDGSKCVSMTIIENEKEEVAPETPNCTPSLSDTEQSEIQLWKEYKNSKYKYSFKYPQTWTISSKTDDSLSLEGTEAGINFQFNSGPMGVLAPVEYSLDSEEKVDVTCEEVTKSYLSLEDTRMIAVQLTKNNNPHVIFITYQDLGASISGDIVDAFNLILKTIEFE